MNISLFIGIVALLGGIYFWIGKSASKELQSDDDYFLMGRKLSLLPLTFTLLATQLGGGSLLGAAQEAYQSGWIVLLYPLGATLGLFALATGFGGKLRELNIATVAEVFEKVYRSKPLRLFASSVSIFTTFLILVAQSIAARSFFTTIGFDQPIIFIIFWSILIAYTVMGGLKAVVQTDVLQALFIIAALVITLLSTNVPIITESLPLTRTESIFEIPWCSWLFMPLLFMLIEQDMGQRCFAAKNTKVITMSAIGAGILLMLCSATAIYFGNLARECGIQVENNASILIESIIILTNPITATLFMVAIFLAIISTADSLLCSIGSNISYDFFSGRGHINTSRLLTLLTGIGSLVFAFLFDNVVSVLMFSYEISVSILFVPIVAAIILPQPSRTGAYFSMSVGFLGCIFFLFIDLELPHEIITILLSYGGYVLGQQFDKKTYTDRESVWYKFFLYFRKTVLRRGGKYEGSI